MHPIEAFVRNPVKVSVGVLLLTLFGIVSLFRMPMQLTPEVETPTISIETRWPGASPAEIEREIVLEQEEQLKSVEGVVKMTSECRDSRAQIDLEFKVGENMEEALIKVNSRLQQVPEYPVDADKPVISTSSSSDRPIAYFILSARIATNAEVRQFQKEHPELAADLDPVLETDNPGLAELRLRRAAAKHPEIGAALLPPDVDVPTQRKFAEDIIEAQFERVEGVSNSEVLGGRDPELQVIVDPQRLAARQLTFADVRTALQSQNKDTSGGDFWEDKRRYIVRTLGQFKSPQQVENQIIAVRGESPVYIRDVAEVRLGYKKPDSFVRRFGSKAIALSVVRENGANVLAVMRGLREENRKLNEGVLKTRNLTLTQVYDETDYINSAVKLVNQNIILGGALTVIVLMTFLHLGVRTLIIAPIIAASAVAAIVFSPWIFLITLFLTLAAGFWYSRGALVVSLAIPISLIGAFLMLHLLDRTLNVISLAGLAFAVGMLVDNAVVVLENIYRHHQMGDPPFQAAVRATKEVWGAVVASTITTLAVFLPVLFVQEEAGQLFRDIALAISSAVAFSLVVSVTVIPTAAARLLRRREEDEKKNVNSSSANKMRATASSLEGVGQGFVTVVVALNAWIQKGLMRRCAVVAMLVGASLLVSYWLWPKVEYLPTGNRNLVLCFITPPPGYNLDQLMEMGQIVEDELSPYWDINPDSPEAEKLDYPVISDFFYFVRGQSVTLGLRSADPSRMEKLIELTDKLRPRLPGSIVFPRQSSLFGRGSSAGRNIDIEISGPDLNILSDIGNHIFRQVRPSEDPNYPPVIPGAQARPTTSLDFFSNPELHVKPKLRQAADLGISATDLGFSVNALIDGAYVTDYYIGGDKIDLSVLGSEYFQGQTQDLEALPIATPSGLLVPVSALAEVELVGGPEKINRLERQRAIIIQVTPPPEIPLEEAIDIINLQVIAPMRAAGKLGPEYTINLSGAADKLRQTWQALKWNFILALLITYLLMAALFESWIHPFVIIMSVPLGAAGGIAALKLLGFYLEFLGQPPQSLDVLTMLGFVILIGTVVNNAILIVHQSLNYMRDHQMTSQEAILESIRTRIRPIFMTTATTVFGLAPLVLFPGAGSELYRGLGSVVLGGLLVSTIFTLVLVPTLFSLMLDLKQFSGKLLGLQVASSIDSAVAHSNFLSNKESVQNSTQDSQEDPKYDSSHQAGSN